MYGNMDCQRHAALPTLAIPRDGYRFRLGAEDVPRA